jgi:hypothetical protein
MTAVARRVGKGANGSAQGAADDRLRAVPTKTVRQAPMFRYPRFKIEGGAFFVQTCAR